MENPPGANIFHVSSLPIEILFKILDNFDVKSLFSYRLISQLWCEVSSKILQSRPSILVRPSRLLDLTNEDSIASFIDCFKVSKEFGHSFPCFNFIFKAEELDYSSELEAFFDLMKQPVAGSELLIKCLHVDEIKSVRYNPIIDLNFVLFRKIPELSKLNLRFQTDEANERDNYEDCFGGDCEESGHESQRCKYCKRLQEWPKAIDESDLPNLQVLQLENCVEQDCVNFFKKILQAAPNLQRIEGTGYSEYNGDYHYRVFHKDQLEPLLQPNKLHLIKQCKLLLSEKLVASGVLSVEQLSGFQPKVVVVALEDCGSDHPRRHPSSVHHSNSINECIVRVLRIVKDSVQDLRSEACFDVLNHANLPVFTKLRRLHWKVKHIKINGDAFPKLEKICLSLVEVFGHNHWIFPARSHVIPVIPSVHSLELEAFGLFNEAFLESMAQMCPNLRHLKIAFCVKNREFEVSSVGPVIWNGMKQLKTLELDNMLPSKMDSMERMEMEAWFTGFSLLTVHQLEDAKPEDRPKVDDVEPQRVNASILNMTELEKLVIGKVDGDQGPVLPLSFKYAFDLMRGLLLHFSPTI